MPNEGKELLASIIISTFNRCDALIETLRALARQTVPADEYEIIVVDDGSADETYAAASALSLPCALKVFRHPENRGVSAGRNLAMRHARGRYLILVSDDLIVPENFVATHLETLARFPSFWVIGGFTQLESLTKTPFGRYLDKLEKSFDIKRKLAAVDTNIWELSCPTARNLSLPRLDYERIGPFDEQFRTTCEDQDWAHRAMDLGIRFLYNDTITCLHNDQAGDLHRHCRFQMRGARDTVLLCNKYPAIHGSATIAHVNGYASPEDGLALRLKKSVKSFFAVPPVNSLFEKLISIAEALHLPDPVLWRLYRTLIGVYIFRGWREGLRNLESRRSALNAPGLGFHPNP